MHNSDILCINFVIFTQNMNNTAKQEEILQSTTDVAEWNLEVERVLPQLKVTVRTDNKVWKNGFACVHVVIKMWFQSMLFAFCLQLSFVMQKPVSNVFSSATLSEPLSVTLTLEAVIFSKVFFQHYIFFCCLQGTLFLYIYSVRIFFQSSWHFQCIHTSKKIISSV